MAKGKGQQIKDSSATIGFEAKLWLTADKLRNNMDAAEYKHVVLGLIFPGAGLKIAWDPLAAAHTETRLKP
jgi:type I restriction-modification system DNA methylase subunit